MMKPGIGRQRTEDRSQRTADGRQRTEGRGQIIEVGRRKAEIGKKKK